MIPDVSQALSWLESHPNALDGIRRGIERETLRVTPEGHLATTPHPAVLGKALTHPGLLLTSPKACWSLSRLSMAASIIC